MKKIIYITTIFLLSIIIIFNLCSIFNISFFGYRLFKVATGSMEPKIKVGEVILINDNAKYKKDDVVTYEYKGTYITHRVVKVEKDYLITKGDANNTVDEAVPKKNVVGKMVAKLGVLSFINYLVGMPIIWVIILVVGLIVILLFPNYKKIKGVIVDNDVI